MKRILLFLVLFLGVVFFALASGGSDDGGKEKKYTIATVVKLDGVSWFDRMEEGIEKFGEETGNETFMLGPAQADAALQVQIIENLIAQKVDAIAVVPFSAEAVEPVLKKAREAGIVVIGHEASALKNVDATIEAFDNKEFGKEMAKYLVDLMGGEGEMANFVGSLTSLSHNEQQDGVEEYIKDFPKIKLVSRRNEDYDDQTRSYSITKELLVKYPNLKGIIGSSSIDAPGAGLAVEERGLQDQVSVVGVSVPSDNKQYIKTGAVDKIAFWDPALAGYVMNAMAVKILNGETIKDGEDFGVEGYRAVKQDKNNPKLFVASAWVFVDNDNIDDYDF